MLLKSHGPSHCHCRPRRSSWWLTVTVASFDSHDLGDGCHRMEDDRALVVHQRAAAREFMESHPESVLMLGPESDHLPLGFDAISSGEHDLSVRWLAHPRGDPVVNATLLGEHILD